MRFSIGDRVTVSEVPEVKRELHGKDGVVIGISSNDIRVKIISKTHTHEYKFFESMLRKQDEPFGSNEAERRVKYLKSSGVKCPFCDLMNISASPLEANAGIAWTDVACHECENSWCDTYELVHYDEDDITKSRSVAIKPKKNVVIEGYGGVADVTQCPAGVEVDIIDHDNRDEEEAI